jgi:hypothetical protein
MSIGRLPTLGSGSATEPELTPAASETLDQNIEFVRAQILHEISRKTGRSGYRARASDVDSAVRQISFFDSASRIVPRTTVFAVILSSASLLVQVTWQLAGSRTAWLDTGVALLVGTASGTAIVVVIQEIRRHRRLAIEPAREFLRACAGLEDSMRTRARELVGPIADNTSLGRVISALELLQLWTPEDSQAFRRILATRNTIVHEDSRAISSTEIAFAFSGTSRLYSLLSGDRSRETKNPLKEIAASRAALSYEERIANTLRRAGIRVSSVQRDAGYDFMAWKADMLTRVIVKYRHSGILTVSDVNRTADQSPSDIASLIVTNVEISPYVNEYLELLRGQHIDMKQIAAVRWQSSDDTGALVKAMSGQGAEA